VTNQKLRRCHRDNKGKGTKWSFCCNLTSTKASTELSYKDLHLEKRSQNFHYPYFISPRILTSRLKWLCMEVECTQQLVCLLDFKGEFMAPEDSRTNLVQLISIAWHRFQPHVLADIFPPSMNHFIPMERPQWWEPKRGVDQARNQVKNQYWISTWSWGPGQVLCKFQGPGFQSLFRVCANCLCRE
jgi:hypothetical protein